VAQPIKPVKGGKRRNSVGQVTPQSPMAPDRGTSAFIPGLGAGYGIGSPFLQTQSSQPRKKQIF